MRVAQFLGTSPWGAVTPALVDRGAGGRETAVVRTSAELARLGHEVISFVPLDGERPVVAGGEQFVSNESAVPLLRSFPFDAVVAVEAPWLFRDEGILEAQRDALRLTLMQVAHFSPGDLRGLTAESCSFAGLSPWHCELLSRQLPREWRDDAVLGVVPNGCALELYPRERALAKEGREARFCYTSSPDRGLDRLFEAWPSLKRAMPASELFVAYGAAEWAEGPAAWSHTRGAEVSRRVRDGLKLPGVVDSGRMGQRDLAELQLSCEMMLYPCDTMQPTETGCVTLLEACASGAYPLTTDCDCIGQEFGAVAGVMPLPFGPERYVAAVLSLIEDASDFRERRLRARDFAERRSWRCSADALVALWEQHTAALGRAA